MEGEGFRYETELDKPASSPSPEALPQHVPGPSLDLRQYAGFGTAEEANRRFRYLIEQGQTGLSVAFDLPTQWEWIPTTPWRPVRSAKRASP